MGSRPRWGDRGGYDLLVTTSKGEKGIGTFGVIIPTGYAHAQKSICEFINQHPYYVAKHCEDVNEITHITGKGFVNRYGYLFTKKVMDISKDISVDKGWFTRKNFSTKEEMLEFVSEIIKEREGLE